MVSKSALEKIYWVAGIVVAITGVIALKPVFLPTTPPVSQRTEGAGPAIQVGGSVSGSTLTVNPNEKPDLDAQLLPGAQQQLVRSDNPKYPFEVKVYVYTGELARDAAFSLSFDSPFVFVAARYSDGNSIRGSVRTAVGNSLYQVSIKGLWRRENPVIANVYAMQPIRLTELRIDNLGYEKQKQ